MSGSGGALRSVRLVALAMPYVEGDSMVEFDGIEWEKDRRVTVALDAADGVPAMKRLHDGQSAVVDVPKDRLRRATPHWRVNGEFPLA